MIIIARWFIVGGDKNSCYMFRLRSLLLLIFIGIACPSAYACSFAEKTPEQRFMNATRVFRAKIISTELSTDRMDGEKFEIVKAKYSLIESYKGKNPKKGIVKEIPFGPGNCMLGLLTGLEYVIYLEGNDYVTMPSGSWGYFNAEGTEVVPELEKLRALANKSM